MLVILTPKPVRLLFSISCPQVGNHFTDRVIIKHFIIDTLQVVTFIVLLQFRKAHVLVYIQI